MADWFQQNAPAQASGDWFSKNGPPPAPPESSLTDDIGDTLKQYWAKINPVTAAQAMVHAAVHLPESLKNYGADNEKIGNAAIDAFKGGDYASGLRHSIDYFAQMIPGLGSSLDEAGNKVQKGDYKGAIADTAALATQIVAGKVGPKILDAATEPGAAGNAARAVTTPVKKAASVVADAATNPHVLKGTGAAIGGAVGHATGIPGAGLAGAYVGREAGAAIADRFSGPPAPEIPPIYDEIAKSLGGKDYASLGPAAQEAVQKFAANQQAAAPPMEAPAPDPNFKVNAGAPVRELPSLGTQLEQYLSSNRAQMAPSISPAGPPIELQQDAPRPPLRPPLAKQAAASPVPITRSEPPPAPSPAPVNSGPTAIQEATERLGSVPRETQDLADAYHARGDVPSPLAAARKDLAIAEHMRSKGITADVFQNVTDGQRSSWGKDAKYSGISKDPKRIADVAELLRKTPPASPMTAATEAEILDNAKRELGVTEEPAPVKKGVVVFMPSQELKNVFNKNPAATKAATKMANKLKGSE